MKSINLILACFAFFVLGKRSIPWGAGCDYSNGREEECDSRWAEEGCTWNSMYQTCEDETQVGGKRSIPWGAGCGYSNGREEECDSRWAEEGCTWNSMYQTCEDETQVGGKR